MNLIDAFNQFIDGTRLKMLAMLKKKIFIDDKFFRS